MNKHRNAEQELVTIALLDEMSDTSVALALQALHIAAEEGGLFWMNMPSGHGFICTPFRSPALKRVQQLEQALENDLHQAGAHRKPLPIWASSEQIAAASRSGGRHRSPGQAVT